MGSAAESAQAESPANGDTATHNEGEPPAEVKSGEETKPAEENSASSGAKPPDENLERTDIADEQVVQSTEKLTIEEETAKLADNVDPILQEDDETSSDEPAKDDMREENVTVRRTRLDPPRTLETTMFDRLERMFGAGIKRLLAVQYR